MEMEALSYTLRLRERLMIRLVQKMHPLYEKWFRRGRPAWQQDVPELLAYEKNSLGFALGSFLDQYQLPLIPRFEDHEVFHVILDYRKSVLAESEMQFCLLGNGNRSLSVLGSCVIVWLVFPEFWSAFRAAFKRGRTFRPFYHWYFEYLLAEPLDELRAFIQKEGKNDPTICF